MPYTITTSYPAGSASLYPPPLAPVPAAPHRTVATLDEARVVIRDLVVKAGIAHGTTADPITDAGGTIGPLPDGTVIEVEFRTWLEALALTNVILVGQYPSPSEQRLILAALNR